MTKHTPGPWKHEAHQLPTGSWFASIFNGEDDIAYLTLRQHEVRANARLIAAAPELLEACASVWSALADSNDTALSALAQECRAAIAKAEAA